METSPATPASAQDASTGLALSGGGFRATLFHIGGIVRLNELGWLPRVDTVTGCSGGAITAAWLGLCWNRLEFDQSGVATNLDDVYIKPLRRLCRGNHDVWPSLSNMAAMLIGLHSDALVHAYSRCLFGKATLGDLPVEDSGPRVVICTSNLATGAEVHFSRDEVRDARLGSMQMPETSLARIVAASSAFPPFLSPCIVRTDPDKWQPAPGADLHQEEQLKRRMLLTDGGVHDPLGLEPVRGCRTLLISDATVTREVWRTTSSFWIRQLGRTTIMQTIANSRRVAREMVEQMKVAGTERRIFHWCNAGSIDAFGLDDALARDSKTTRDMGEMRTRLNHFTPLEQELLINWGYATCDAALRSGADTACAPGRLPAPETRLD